MTQRDGVGLSVLDLVPISSGSTPGEALRNTLDLARQTEALGYHRYWIAEHHMNPGVAGSSPAVVVTMVAGGTSTIRVGSGAVQLSHQTPLTVVEQFGLIDALHPARIDLGLGRSFLRRPRPAPDANAERHAYRTERGFVVPAPPNLAHLARSARIALQRSLLDRAGEDRREYADEVADVMALLDGTYERDGVEAHAVPGTGARLEVWIVGSTAGESAEVAGARGLPLAANYHVSPASVLEAVAAYREAFRPSARLDRPRVIVSADAVVAPTDAEAHRLAAGYGHWVRSIRTGEGAIPYPTPDEAAAMPWNPDDRALVEDRLCTRFVGCPKRVADGLAVLAAETGADEVLVTTVTHEHADRRRSYELLATEWAGRA